MYRILIGCQLYYSGCASCAYLDIVLYSQHLPSNKSECLNLHVVLTTWLNKTTMVMHINWSVELCNDIRMIVVIMMILLYVQQLYVVCVLIC